MIDSTEPCAFDDVEGCFDRIERSVPVEQRGAIVDARQAGIDLQMLQDSIASTVEERWRRHGQLLRFSRSFRGRLNGRSA